MLKPISFSVVLLALAFSSCQEPKTNSVENTSSEKTKTISAEAISKTTVFNAGDDGIDSYRIPSLVTAKDGSLLLFAEGRKESSVDKSPTDLVFKRSEDNGKTWSSLQILADGKGDAYMDPTALVDDETGKVFLFVTLWPKDDHSQKSNTAWLLTSEDHGKTWSDPVDITAQISAKDHYLNGFGPGSGLQLKGDKYKNRLVMPTRQVKDGKMGNRAIYSDDGGETWEIGESTQTDNEYMIAESPHDTLIYNLRGPKGKRLVARSYDGGKSWTEPQIDFELQSAVDYGGVEGSILGFDNILFFSAPAGGLGSDKIEDRQNLMLYRSFDGGQTWSNKHLLYPNAAGYSSITALKEGGLAIVFETADEASFPKLLPDYRPAGWMRLDVIILPKEVLDKAYWF